METPFYIPKDEHPFEVALVGKERLLCRLRLDEDEYDGSARGFFIEFDVSGEMKFVIVDYDFQLGSLNARAPEQGDEFPVYGINEARRIFKKYVGLLVAVGF